MDPEQLYQEVLTEEQQKGSTPAVAEARAKAARARAEHGSPHPKEPKWWPGAQPHLEGDGAGPQETADVAQAPAEEVVEAQADNEAASAAPAATEEQQTPVVESDAPVAPAAPAPIHPAPQPAEQVPAAVAAAPAPVPAAAPAAAAVAPAPVATTGVTHGVATGTRLRPEDEVATESQFEGQRAMYERRRLIDEVIQTGVPATAAAGSERSSSAALALLYLLIPLAVIFYLASNGPEPTVAEDGGETTTQEGGETGNTVVAENTAFTTDTLEAAAGEKVTYTLDNRDEGVKHNFALYESENPSPGDQALYTSPDTTGPASVDITFTAPKDPGDYPYICDYHPTTMKGTLTVTK